ncbi:DUF2117 family protein [Methanosarcina sp. 2.H.A.1B.4]|uniref:DUF2117 family protein n=1 Tax=Methanosarcina sp. 2.H.A.1B.4 TaxID=1483600 RepID=UPI000620F721|nr:DUF2117 domain-containing protein [Methanosarcina sp. 2.H.A.1B.4]KKG10063.1 hypothetical protein EO92_02110 [Methanosarcina sp. 2.H.A.1B.4]
MKISLVIHGPEVIDSGEAEIVLEKLSCIGEVETQLGGTMGKTAVLDAGLENVIDISRHLKPSACIESFFETSDLVCLLNRGKTPETGMIFGAKVASRLKDPEKKPLIQIESPGCTSGKLIPLNKKAGSYIEKLSEAFGLPAEKLLSFHNPVSRENVSKTGKARIIREISGVFPGENILVNGLVIGKALSSGVRIIAENGFIISIEGGEIKEHGLEKLHNYEKRDPVDLAGAWVKSGDIRRSNSLLPDARKEDPSARKSGPISWAGAGTGKVVLIDHDAENSYELASGAKLAVTIGDDTTAIAGDILFRLGIPIIGITDGDCDNVTCETKIFPGSVVLRLIEGSDDIVGKRVKQELLRGQDSAVFENLFAFKEDVLKLAELSIEAVFEY